MFFKLHSSILVCKYNGNIFKTPFTTTVCSLTVQTLELSMSSVVVSGQSELSLRRLPMESWMSHLPCALWDTPLYHLAIPGRRPCNSTPQV